MPVQPIYFLLVVLLACHPSECVSPHLLQAVINGMVFAFIYLVLQKYQVLSEVKGEPLFSTKISNCLLFASVVSFIVSMFLVSAFQSLINIMLSNVFYVLL